MASGYGNYAGPDIGKKVFAMTMQQSAEYLKENYHVDKEIPEMVQEINDIVNRFYLSEVLLKDGVLEILDWLDEENIPCAVATATDIGPIFGALKHLNIASRFKGILTCTQVGAGKDSPLIYQKAAEIIGVKPEEACVVEDALHGLITAKKAGFITAGVYDAASEEQQEDLRKNADIYGRNMIEILEKIKKNQ